MVKYINKSLNIMYHHFLDTLKLTKIIIFDPGYRVKPYYTEFKRGPCAILCKKIKEDMLAKSVTYKKNLPRGRNATDQMCCCCAHSVQLAVRCACIQVLINRLRAACRTSLITFIWRLVFHY